MITTHLKGGFMLNVAFSLNLSNSFITIAADDIVPRLHKLSVLPKAAPGIPVEFGGQNHPRGVNRFAQ